MKNHYPRHLRHTHPLAGALGRDSWGREIARPAVRVAGGVTERRCADCGWRPETEFTPGPGSVCRAHRNARLRAARADWEREQRDAARFPPTAGSSAARDLLAVLNGPRWRRLVELAAAAAVAASLALVAGCASAPPPRPPEEAVCYTPAENAALRGALIEQSEEINSLNSEADRVRRRDGQWRTRNEGLKGYCT
jgi:hypothetical protein